MDQTLLDKLKAIEETVVKYFPEALNSVKIALSVSAVLSFESNSQPTVGVHDNGTKSNHGGSLVSV